MERPELTKASASERYRRLVYELGQQLDFAHGWKTAVAKQLGVHPSYIGKIEKGQVDTVGVDVIERAMERLLLKKSYFFGPIPDNELRLMDHQEVESDLDLVKMAPPEVDEIRDRNMVSREATWARAYQEADRLLNYVLKRRRPPSSERIEALARAVMNLEFVELARQLLERPMSAAERRDLGLRLAALTLTNAPSVPYLGEEDDVDEKMAERLQGTKEWRERVRNPHRPREWIDSVAPWLPGWSDLTEEQRAAVLAYHRERDATWGMTPAEVEAYNDEQSRLHERRLADFERATEEAYRAAKKPKRD